MFHHMLSHTTNYLTDGLSVNFS